jgi:beta-lactamase regulating signal transducer with metallopeptidase domain
MLALLLESAARSLALGVAVWLGLKFLRVRNPHCEMTAWRLVLAASLAMPLLMQVLAPWATVTIPASAPLAQIVIPEAAKIAQIAPATSSQAPSPAARPLTEDISAPAPVDPGVNDSMPGSRKSISQQGWITVIYVLVGGTLLLRLLIGIVLTFRLIRTARPLEEPWTAGCDVRISNAVSMPVTFGSTILLPADCIDWGTAKRQAVLSHEKSHIDHGDFFILMLASLHRAVFWFNPLSWWLLRRLTELAEIISDDAAVAVLRDQHSYAAILLDIAGNARPVAAGVAMARPQTVRWRIERLLAATAPATPITLRRRLGLALALLPRVALAAIGIARGAPPTQAVAEAQVVSAEQPTLPALPWRGRAEGLPGRELEDGFWFWRHKSGPDQPSSNDPAFGLAFLETPSVCLEGREALQISRGVVWFIQPRESFRRMGVRGRSMPIDNETHLRLIGTEECVIEFRIRAQVNRDGQWTPLLVPKSMRPDLSEDERRELAEQRRELAEQLRAAAERLRNRRGAPSEEERQVWQAWRNGPGNLPRMLRLQEQTGAQSTFLEFEEIPQACVEAFGELSLNQTGISFSFPTHFPDDLDRFTVEHRRLDDFRAQLLLVGRNCRVEMTIGKDIRADGRWLSIQLDAIHPSG